MLPFEWIENAQIRLAGKIHPTPLTYDANLNSFIKWESYQITGSFKLRGAINKVSTLEKWELERGLVTASAGNHGLGVAYAGQAKNIPVHVYCSRDARPAKLDAMRALQAELHLIDGGYASAEAAAKLVASTQGSTYVSAYNDPQVIAGQATIALDILADLPSDLPHLHWIIPVGGGGLISGMAQVIRRYRPQDTITGVQAANSPFGWAVFHQRSQAAVVESPTAADGLAGAIDEHSITIPMMRTLVDDIILVEEQAIIEAMAYAWHRIGEPVEPSAAVSLAARIDVQSSPDTTVIVITGNNLDLPTHHSMIQSSKRFPLPERNQP